MTTQKLVRFEVEGSVARLTLAHPPLNILTVPMMDTINAALAEAASRPTLRAVVLAAQGRAFSAGVAIEDHQGERVQPMLNAFHQIFRHLHALDCPTVAAVGGPALGGGAELATFCDVVVASETATLGQPEIRAGVFAPIAAIHYPKRIGETRARQLLLSGQTLSAQEAERIGLVDRVVPAADLETAVAAVLAGFADKSAAVLRLTKRAVRLAHGGTFELALARLEGLYLTELMATADAAEGLRAFLEKRQPVWTDR
jgi:cyclohexa-1,5-dienecarbonyl-CoA hydratase